MGITVKATQGKVIHIGRAGENLATTVIFDVADWISTFGSDGTFTLYVQQNGLGYYPQPDLIQPGDSSEYPNCVVWNITNSNTIAPGLGKCELSYSKKSDVQKPLIQGYYSSATHIFYENFDNTQATQYTDPLTPNTAYQYKDKRNTPPNPFYYDGMAYQEVSSGDPEDPNLLQNIIVKSIIYDIVVTNSLDIEAASDVPEPIETWLEEISELVDDITHAKDYSLIAEGYAVGTQEGVEDPSSSYYHNNAEYYADQAEGFAHDAGEDASDARDYSLVSEGYAVGTQDGSRVESGIYYQNNAEYYKGQASDFATAAHNWANNGDGSSTPSSTNNAKYYAELAHAWANNGDGSSTPDSTNNAKYYADQADNSVIAAGAAVTNAQKWATGGTGGTPTEQNNAKYYSERSALWATGGTSGDPTNNNAKYYAELTESLAVRNVTTGLPSSPAAASVTKDTTQTPHRLLLDLTIPKGDTGAQGEQGEQGFGLRITETVATEYNLPSAAIAGAGTAYGVGTSAPYDIYISNGSSWTNYGTIGGVSAVLVDWTQIT